MPSTSTDLAEAHWSVSPPAGQWLPSIDAAGLARIACLLRGVKPLEAIVDDVGDVLGEQDPRESEFGEIAERLRGDLRRLDAIAQAAGDKDAHVRRLLQRARTLRSKEIPVDCSQSLGHLRRMAGVVNDLLERLVETRTVKEIA
ncbi:DUF6415 family natural product biosynthesis protein [Streptomyces sp. NPDC051217]|uniref:DUF6415 family natural product biosynthesis protein n=1 Tax=Streptomyces sp. NPDC051217 TaxID=3365644 RepID=UPI0037B9CF07